MFNISFPDRTFIAETTAKMLLEIEAVRFRSDEPYKFTSGLASPVYIDCRKLISYPRIRGTLMEFAASIVLREIGFEQIDSVAGGETAGIPFAAWIADKLDLPMQYVRKQAKGFGRDAQIEGDLTEGEHVLLVEDLTTDGGSKIRFCEALRRAGATVTDTVVIFYYDIFPGTRDMLVRHGLRLHYLATWRDVFDVCKSNNYFDGAILSEVDSFLNDPLRWSGVHGGATELPE